MMSKELLKKAGILSVAFGLVASPAAFAQEPADPANNITPDEQPVEAQSENTTDPSNYDSQELNQDEGDNVSDMEPSSTSHDDSEPGYDSTDELPEENGGM
ncbi:hypothetical protein [Vreelandella venusta]|uniref:hypothetical protein n=1 Tax=Vreelandella venusta TaxID=44935 RepID=UPI002286CBDC|nr:hypothetical protein [Halomonas venusta]WAM48543.1 hypothetical protein L0521_17580 [Halomonas venusta]